MRFEYKVVPAPRRGQKARGLTTTEERFALALSHVMNELGHDGWDYLRADTLPVDERSGLTGTKTSYHNMLVFRRMLRDAAEDPLAERLAAGVSFGGPRLGAATDVTEGAAPSLGAANAGIAAK